MKKKALARSLMRATSGRRCCAAPRWLGLASLGCAALVRSKTLTRHSKAGWAVG